MLSWAKDAIEKLQSGESVKIEHLGNSMKGKIGNKHIVTLKPLDSCKLKENDIVLVRLKGKDYLHLIKETGKKKLFVGDMLGFVEGWVKKKDVYGIVVDIEKN